MRAEGPHWAALDAALEACAADGRPVDFWLRDDDAVAPTPSLERLLALAADHGVPLALAVIPAGATPALADRLAGLAGVTVLQHGFSHADHSAPGAKKCELGLDRPADVVLGELVRGRELLSMFARTAPVLVPPWNRIDPALAARLPDLGFAALSTYGDRPLPSGASGDAAGLVLINTHVDPVDWHGGRGFLGEAAVLGRLSDRLRRMAAGSADRSEATGILTHHLVHDDETFDFVEKLLQTTTRQGFCRWHSPETLLGLDGPGKGAPAR
ncbi:polysaccharide deacetylase family protein [Aureimonas glaciei]|uniref:Polysaccharide deacetylase n=1 Tax=Aureimonas glaciei TaxID=1776957 RepID=A0A916XSJ3_9HYPH|nr:polysaccharide deacetylase family protein [Aureimonas glaciei]GGD04045.1 polysaccharide deacetylase [Aureimonas glaciei]